MSGDHDPAATPTYWAKVRLTRGVSDGEYWEITSEFPEARLTLGADPNAGWRIEAAGVKPTHCEIFWDGQALWVADTLGAGGVFLDGQRVREWTQIQGPSEVRFGQASMDIETSAPMRARMVSDPGLALPKSLNEATRLVRHPVEPVFGGAASPLTADEMRTGQGSLSLEAAVGRPPEALPGEPTRMAAGPDAPGGMDLRPRFGGSEPAAHNVPSAAATRMWSMADAPPSTGAVAKVVAPPPSAPPSPPLAPAAQLPPAAADPPPMGVVAAPGSASSGFAFAAPPPTAAELTPSAEPWYKRLLKHEESRELEGKQAIPTRTWVLLVVTVLVTVGWLLLDEEPAPEPAAARTSATEAPTDAVTEDETPSDSASQEPETPPVAAVDPSPPLEEESEDEDGPTMQRRAADAYIAGRFVDAKRLYERLALRDPQNEAFSAMVRLLERRINGTEAAR